MKEFAYKNGSAHLEFVLPNSKYTSNFKIDTGAFITALPVAEFKNFSSKDIMSGEYKSMSNASGGKMEGYTHKVLVKIVGCNKNVLLDICFYDGLRGLFGMDMISKHFNICFKKDKYLLQIN